MIVAVVAMRMMQAAVNQIVDMIAMWHRRMAAVRAMNVPGGVFRRGKARRAFVRIGGGDGDGVLVIVACVRMVQMVVVKIVHMAFMDDGRVSAIRTVDVGMIGVSGAGMWF